MHGIRRTFFITLIAISVISACSGQATPTPSLPEISEPVLTEPTARLPLTEADVPRVTVEDAKAALDRGEAIIVDVRSADAYRASHAAGAVHVELGEFEVNPTAVPLNQDQWIITYCT